MAESTTTRSRKPASGPARRTKSKKPSGPSAKRPTTQVKKGRVEPATGARGTAARKVKGPVLAAVAAAASVAGGVLLKRQIARPRRKTRSALVPALSVDGLVRSSRRDLKPIGKRISKAGKRIAKAGEQAGRLADDVQRAGKSAERLGKSLS